MSTARPNYAEIAKKHRGSVHTVMPTQTSDQSEHFPPELSRLVGTLNPQFVNGKPLPDGGIASVNDGDAHTIEINDPAKYIQGKGQVNAHELTHLWQQQISPPLAKQIPPDTKTGTYDISNLDDLRKKGIRFLQLPREKQASILQKWVASPVDRPKLQPWLDDMGKVPLSIMEPTDPSAKELNRHVRPPLPPK